MPANNQLYAVWAYRYRVALRRNDWVIVRYTYDPSDSLVLSPLNRPQPSRVLPA